MKKVNKIRTHIIIWRRLNKRMVTVKTLVMMMRMTMTRNIHPWKQNIASENLFSLVKVVLLTSLHNLGVVPELGLVAENVAQLLDINQSEHELRGHWPMRAHLAAGVKMWRLPPPPHNATTPELSVSANEIKILRREFKSSFVVFLLRQFSQA